MDLCPDWKTYVQSVQRAQNGGLFWYAMSAIVSYLPLSSGLKGGAAVCYPPCQTQQKQFTVGITTTPSMHEQTR